MERNKRLYYDSDSDIAPAENRNARGKNIASFSEFNYRGGPGSVDCMSSSSVNSKNVQSSSSQRDSGNNMMRIGNSCNDNNCGDDDVIILQSDRMSQGSSSSGTYRDNSHNNIDNNDNNYDNDNQNSRSYQSNSRGNNHNENDHNSGSLSHSNESTDRGDRRNIVSERGRERGREEVQSPTLSVSHTARRQSSTSSSTPILNSGERNILVVQYYNSASSPLVFSAFFTVMFIT